MRSQEIELSIARHFGIRQNMIVPNVSWGLNMHECDLLIVTASNYAVEVEIKVSRSDILADLKKEHEHSDDRIRAFYFAVPEELASFTNANVLGRAGILTLSNSLSVEVWRNPIVNKKAVKLTDKEKAHLGMLASMRVWKMKGERLNG